MGKWIVVLVVVVGGLAVVARGRSGTADGSTHTVSSVDLPTVAPLLSPRTVVLVKLEAHYVDVLRNVYLPEKKNALEGSGGWYRPYDVANTLTAACGLREEWSTARLGDMIGSKDPIPLDGLEWKTKAEIAARGAADCIRNLRAEIDANSFTEKVKS